MSLVLPGQTIPAEAGFLRGHGTYIVEDEEGGRLVSSLPGEIVRVNKLVSVKSVKSRYLGEVGDLIVGRVAVVDSKRWKIDINGQKDAILQLSSVNLPGGAQRIRTYEDQLQMRTLFAENDLISAEIQNISTDGTISLHTRSLKYGKLENGQLITVPSVLIKRLPQHYVTLPWGIDVLLGKNGSIWITRSIPESWKSEQDPDDPAPLAETLQHLKKKHASTPLTLDERLKIARVRNSIYCLSQVMVLITVESLSQVYNKSIELRLTPKDMIEPQTIRSLTEQF